MQRTLYSGHLSIADIIFRSQLTLPSRTDHSIADTPNNRPYKTFLVRNLYTFYFGQCFTILFDFFSIFVRLFRSIKMKNCRYFQSVFTSMIDVFSSCEDVSAQWDKDRNMDIIMEISAAHGQPPLPQSVNQYTLQKQHSCPILWLALSHITNVRQKVAFKLTYKQYIL